MRCSGALAQLGARHNGIVEATGSNPVCSIFILDRFSDDRKTLMGGVTDTALLNCFFSDGCEQKGTGVKLKMKEKRSRNYEMDMCSGPILRKLLIFAIPLMCSSILQMLFNAADTVVIGKFAGDNSLAAVGSNASLISLMTSFFIGLSVGANVLAARYYGARQEKELHKAVHTAILLSLISGVVLMAAGMIFARQMLELMQSPKEVRELAALYLRIYFIGMPATMIYNFGSAVLRAVGDTRRPLYYLMGAGVINVGLNLLFVIVFRMDVAGVALATVISQSISAFLILRCLMREQGSIRLVLRELSIDREKLLQIVRVGLPAGLQGVIFGLSNVLIQSSINGFGAIVVAGNSAAESIENFVYFGMNAVYQATISFTSQNMGAGNYKRINRIMLSAQLCVITVGLVMGNLFVLFGHELLSFYSSNALVIQAGMNRLSLIARVYALCGMMDVMVGVMRGIGYSVLPMIVSLLGACGFRILWLATVFQMQQYHTVDTIYLSYPISWLLTFTAHFICYLCVKRRIGKPKEKML